MGPAGWARACCWRHWWNGRGYKNGENRVTWSKEVLDSCCSSAWYFLWPFPLGSVLQVSFAVHFFDLRLPVDLHHSCTASYCICFGYWLLCLCCRCTVPYGAFTAMWGWILAQSRPKLHLLLLYCPSIFQTSNFQMFMNGCLSSIDWCTTRQQLSAHRLGI